MAGDGDNIYVASGVYTPRLHSNIDQFPEEGAQTFQISKDNLHIYGGFFPGFPETHHDDRMKRPEYPTPLSKNLPTLAAGTVLTGQGRIFTIMSIGGTAGLPTGVIIDGFNFARGNADAEPPLGSPGGVHVIGTLLNRTTATIRNCYFMVNNARLGGAMYTANSTVTVEDCAFYENTAGPENLPEGSGGAVFIDGGTDITFKRCLFSENAAAPGVLFGAGGEGGAIVALGSDVVLQDSIFEKNTAFFGGAVKHEQCDNVDILRCIFRNNRAENASGGALLNVCGGSTAVYNSLFHNNLATVYSGAIENFACSGGDDAFFDGCTIANNHAGETGGGISNWISEPVIKNSILWGNTQDQVGAAQIFDNVPSVSTVEYSDIEGGWAGATNIDVDPEFIDPNGPKPDYRIGGASPARDAGDPNSLREQDLTGRAGTLEGGDLESIYVDMGAHEFILRDCNENGTADECELDCDAGEFTCDYATAHNCGFAPDCDSDDVIDSCGLWSAIDICEIFAGECIFPDKAWYDWDGNGSPDPCDIAGNSSLDADEDGCIDDVKCNDPPGLARSAAVAQTNWSDGTTWSGGVAPNNNGTTYNVGITGAATDIVVDVNVVVDTLGLDEGNLNVIGASTGDLQVVAVGV